MNKKIEITTAMITVKVIEVDGHKMTMATFRQIEQLSWDSLNLDILGYEEGPLPKTGQIIIDNGFRQFGVFLGWVSNGGDMWLVFEVDNELRRTLIPKNFTETTKDCFDQLFIAT